MRKNEINRKENKLGYVRTVRYILTLLLSGFLLIGIAEAADYDGYILRLRSDTALLSDEGGTPEGMEEIYAPENLYKTDDEALVRELEDAGLLLYAEPDYLVTLDEMPDDPYCADGTQWSMSVLDMDEVWAEKVTGAGVRIGVIDSGIYAEHEEFAGTAVLEGFNYCAERESEAQYDVSDDVGHGTFVSGLIAAATNNGAGIAGIAPGAELVPLKCFTKTTGPVSAVVAGIYGAVDDYECQILNMSWGMSTDSQTLREAIQYAAGEGVIMVAAVGNLSSASTGSDPLRYPAAYDEVIGVGAVDAGKAIASFSHQNESVFVTAPGKSVIGLSTSGPSVYRTASGTSYAVPAVTAASALALSLRPDMTQAELSELIQETAEDLGEAGYDTVYGYGLLRIGALLKLLRERAEELTYRITDEGNLYLSAGQWGFEPEQTVSVTAAAYRKTGLLLGAASVLTSADQNGLVRFSDLSIDIEPGECSKIKLFFVDADTLRPLCASRQQETEETGAPAG